MTQQIMYPALVNSPETTITANISAEDVFIPILNASSIPPSLPNLMVLGTGTNAETVLVDDENDGVLTVVRGFQGTAKSWLIGTIIARNDTAYDFDTFKANIEDLNAQVVNNQLTIANGESFVGFGYEPVGGVVRIDDNDPRITYSKSDWVRVPYPYNREGVFGYATISNNIGATATISFTGVALYAGLKYAGDGALIDVYVDEIYTITIDCYATSSRYDVTTKLADNLSFGSHSIKLIVTGKNSSSTGNYIYIDSLDVLTTTDSSINLAVDGVQNTSSALTLGQLCESDANIAEDIDEITQSIINSDFLRESPTYGEVFKDTYNRADGAVGNGWIITLGSPVISNNKLSLPAASNSQLFNGSHSWNNKQLNFEYVAPSNGISFYLNYADSSNFVFVYLGTGNVGSLTIHKYVNGVDTIISTGNYVINAGSTYYVKGSKNGNIYTLSITTNSDYVSSATVIDAYIDSFTTGIIGFYASSLNSGATLIDNIVVTAPVPYGYTLIGMENTKSIIGNTVKFVNHISTYSGACLTYPYFASVVAGQSYTLKIQRKLSSYTSGDGATARIIWYQSDGSTIISYNDSVRVTAIDSDFVEVTVTGTAPSGAVYADAYGRFDGIGTVEWKEALFELTATATGIYHKKEFQMNLVSLQNDGDIVVTKGYEDELGYRVEETGIISEFYRDKDTILHWDRAKVWTGGTGWTNNNDTSASNGKNIYTVTLNDTYNISFVGVGADIISSQGTSRSIIGITIDNGVEYFVDCYAPSSIYSFKIPIRGLSYGQHQIKIREPNTKNSLAVGYLTVIDAFDIYVPAIPSTPALYQPLGVAQLADPDHGWIRFEENEGVVYSGTWGTENHSGFSGGVDKANSGTNTTEYGEFSFLGNGIRYIGLKAITAGIIDVFINDILVSDNLDCYSASTLFQNPIYTNTSLNLELNKIKILCTNTKNASSSAYYVKIDAFEVKQPLYIIDLRKKLPQGTKDYVDKLFNNATDAVNEVHGEVDAHLAENAKYAIFYCDSQSLANDASAEIVWSTKTSINGEDFSEIVPITGRVKILKAGVYEVYLMVGWPSNAIGCRLIGAGQMVQSVQGIDFVYGQYINIVAIKQFTTNELISLSAKQTSGGALNINGAGNTFAMLRRIS